MLEKRTANDRIVIAIYEGLAEARVTREGSDAELARRDGEVERLAVHVGEREGDLGAEVRYQVTWDTVGAWDVRVGLDLWGNQRVDGLYGRMQLDDKLGRLLGQAHLGISFRKNGVARSRIKDDVTRVVDTGWHLPVDLDVGRPQRPLTVCRCREGSIIQVTYVNI